MWSGLPCAARRVVGTKALRAALVRSRAALLGLLWGAGVLFNATAGEKQQDEAAAVCAARALSKALAGRRAKELAEGARDGDRCGFVAPALARRDAADASPKTPWACGAAGGECARGRGEEQQRADEAERVGEKNAQRSGHADDDDKGGGARENGSHFEKRKGCDAQGR